MKRAIATVGTFDGLHGGHLSLLERLRREGAARQLSTMAVTFSSHPLATIAPERVPPLLESRQELRRRLETAVDKVLFLDFDARLASLPASRFMAMLHDCYGVDVLLMGYDNNLGSDRLASAGQYVAAGREAGVEVIFGDRYVNPATGRTPASSLLRQLLARGDVEAFAAEAGRPFRFEGSVVHGKRNGHRLGFPTLNIKADEAMAVPQTGVYKARVEIGGNDYPAVVSIGHNPTIAAGNPVTVEAHAIGVDLGDCYGARASVVFGARLRGEQRFENLDQLRRAIAADIEAAK